MGHNHNHTHGSDHTHSPANAPAHFNGKDAIGHVAQAQVDGVIAAAEIHGTEIPGHLSAACDAARETAVFLTLLWLVLSDLDTPFLQIITFLTLAAGGWLIWKASRSTWMGWFRLERLNRVLDEERWEIEHHRQQERDELRVLYAEKGFEGKLLEDVLDVLMADNSRLLKVMVEEELGLSLANHEHPLKQGLGAAIGVICSSLLCLLSLIIWPTYGIFFGAALSISISAWLIARLARNDTIPAIVWNLGMAVLTFGWIYFLIDWFHLAVRNSP